MAYPVTPVKGPRHPCSPLPPTTQPSRLIGDTPSQPIMTPIRHIPADSAPILSRCLRDCGADLGAALLKPAREKILEALRKERKARKKERKLRRQAEGEVKALKRKIDSLEAERRPTVRFQKIRI